MIEIDKRKINKLRAVVSNISIRLDSVLDDLEYVVELLRGIETLGCLDDQRDKEIRQLFERSYQTLYDDACTLDDTDSLFKELVGLDNEQTRI